MQLLTIALKLAKNKSPHHVKFINAVLRQLSRDMENKKLEKLSPLNNIPNVIINKWKDELNRSINKNC